MKKKIERIVPRPAQPNMVGDGFRVFNLIPGAGISQRRMSPFLMLDFAPKFTFEPSKTARGVGVHPHKGFETVSIAYQCAVEHHDSKGNHGIIYPGDVQWMTAGNGILHKEYHETEFSKKGGPMEFVQLWVNLPKENKSVEPHYQALTKDMMGEVVLENNAGKVKIIAGEFNGITGPAKTYTPVNIINFHLNKNGNAKANIPISHNTALVVINGDVQVNDAEVPEYSFVLFENEGEDIEITATTDSVVLLLSGEPINEPIASYGPFVMNTQDEIHEAIRDFQEGKFGVLE